MAAVSCVPWLSITRWSSTSLARRPRRGLRAVRRLDPALLVHAQKTMARCGGSMYSPTMSRTFSTNNGSVESLKVSWPMRLQAEGAPDAPHRGLRQLRFTRHRTGAPVRSGLRDALQSLGDHCIHSRVVDRAGRTRPRRVQQSVQAMLDTATAPNLYLYTVELEPIINPRASNALVQTYGRWLGNFPIVPQSSDAYKVRHLLLTRSKL